MNICCIEKCKEIATEKRGKAIKGMWCILHLCNYHSRMFDDQHISIEERIKHIKEMIKK